MLICSQCVSCPVLLLCIHSELVALRCFCIQNILLFAAKYPWRWTMVICCRWTLYLQSSNTITNIVLLKHNIEVNNRCFIATLEQHSIHIRYIVQLYLQLKIYLIYLLLIIQLNFGNFGHKHSILCKILTRGYIPRKSSLLYTIYKTFEAHW